MRIGGGLGEWRVVGVGGRTYESRGLGKVGCGTKVRFASVWGCEVRLGLGAVGEGVCTFWKNPLT